MERIKKAVEEARKNRGEATSAAPLNFPIDPRPQPGLPEEITYTETKTQAVPVKVLDKNRVMMATLDEAVASTYKMLRTQVLQIMEKNNWSTLAVTSPSAGDGKTLTATNLAQSIAREMDLTVLLVDLDFRRPGLQEVFEYKPEVDLIDHLVNGRPLNEVLFNPGMERLVILPSNGPVDNSSELLRSPKMKALVKELKQRYASRIILFDLPPVLASDDAVAFLPLVDCTLLVVQDGKTTKDELRRTLELLKDINMVGTVLNKSEEALGAGAYY